MIVMKIQLEDTAEGLSAVFLSGLNSVTQHNRGVNVIAVILSGFNLAEDETLHIAFADGVEEGNINQEELAYALMKYDEESGSYKSEVPVQVISKRGTWYLCLAIRSGWDTNEGTYTKQRATGYRPFEVYSSIANRGYPVPSEADIAVLYLSIKESEKNVAESASEAVNAAERAEQSAESAKQFAEQASTAAEQSAASADSAQEAREGAENAQMAAEAARSALDEAASTAESKAAEAITAATNALASAKTAEEFAEIARQFSSIGISFSTDYNSVDELPIPGDVHYFYLIPNVGEGENVYDMYVWVEKKQAYSRIGSTHVDLTAYLPRKEAEETFAKKDDVADMLTNWADIKDWYDETHYQSPTTTLSLLPVGITASVDLTSDNLTRTVMGFTHRETNIDNIPSDLTFSDGDTEVSVAKSATTATVSLDTPIVVTFSSTGTRTATFTLKGINSRGTEFSATAQISSYYPAFYGALSEKPTEDTISQLAKTAGSSITGTREVAVSGDAKYIWFCVPNKGAISNITLNDFPVPFELDGTLEDYKGTTYNLYRTSNKIIAQDDAYAFKVS